MITMPPVARLRPLTVAACACLIPIFFVPVLGGVDVNGVAAILLALVAASFAPQILRRPEIVAFVIAPWLIFITLCVAAEVLLGTRTSLGGVVPQGLFLCASVGLAFGLSEIARLPRPETKLMSIALTMAVSMTAFLLVTAPLENLLSMLQNLGNPITAVWHARRVFAPDSFVAGVSVENLASYQNRIAQHLFAYAMIIASLALLAVERGAQRGWRFYTCIAFAIFLCVVGIVFLSGQVLAQIFITSLFCGAALAIYRTSYRLLSATLAIALAGVLALPALLRSTVFINWYARFTGGNVSTGRFDRWDAYLSEFSMETLLLGTARVNEIDPHNALITALFEAGLLAFLAVLIFFLFVLFYAVWVVRRAALGGLSLLLMLSTGPQIAFTMLIGGGWGMPGLAEWMKFSLFVFGMLIYGPKFSLTRERARLSHTVDTRA
ncbi:MAG: hypothetical protein AAFP13_03755 [Pseudomonadota bacterium]